MLTRRRVIQGLITTLAAGSAFGGYAFGVEPKWRLVKTSYRVKAPGWPARLALRVAVIADLHAGEPYMPVSRIAHIVDLTNAAGADAILLLGDYTADFPFQTKRITPDVTARELGRLKAPLGVHAVLGNHDWWEDRGAQRRRAGPTIARRALETAGIPVYENDAVRLTKNGDPFWLAGLGDQVTFPIGRRNGRMQFLGVDDLDGTLAKVTDTAPVVLMAHEPDVFPRVPSRVALTISGHTHGGQVRIFGYAPVVNSAYGNRYAYGHIIERAEHEPSSAERSLVVSGGLGCSIMPVRFGCPPEIVIIDVAGDCGPAAAKISGA